MKSMEIAVINPKDERQALLAWAAGVDAGEDMAQGGLIVAVPPAPTFAR